MQHTLSDKGPKPDREKVEAVFQMPQPTDVAYLSMQIHASAQVSLSTTEKAHWEECRLGMDRAY